MQFVREIYEQYQIANALAAKSMQKDKKRVLPVCPALLDTLSENPTDTCRQDLGVLEIPVSLIVGVDTLLDRPLLYTKDFLPVPAPDSVFAEAWRSICERFIRHQKIPGEISCYEYLGKFYVRDGRKRVSVAKYMGLDVMKAKVIRILPTRTDSQEFVVYSHFLHCYRLTKLYQLQFTQADFLEKLQKALGRKSGYCWSEADRSRFLQHWPAIERAFRKSYDDSLPITTADALVVLLDRYGFDQIISMDSWMLARVFQACWKELYTLSFSEKDAATSIKTVELLQTA